MRGAPDFSGAAGIDRCQSTTHSGKCGLKNCANSGARSQRPRYGRYGFLISSTARESYDHEAPFARLLQDALALPIFDGGNMGIRR
jgi:hypothetical protein